MTAVTKPKTVLVGATLAGDDRLGPTIEIPDLATASKFIGLDVLLGSRPPRSLDGEAICWGLAPGPLEVKDNLFIAGATTRIIHPRVVIRLVKPTESFGLEVARTLGTSDPSMVAGTVAGGCDVDGEPVAFTTRTHEQPETLTRRNGISMMLPSSTPPAVLDALFDIAEALDLDTDTVWPVTSLAAEVRKATERGPS